MGNALTHIEGFISQQGIDTSAPGWKQSLPKPTKAEFDAGEQPGEQHQGLMPRCRATMPAVIL